MLRYHEDDAPGAAEKSRVVVVGANPYDTAETAAHGYGLFVDIEGGQGGTKRADGAFLAAARRQAYAKLRHRQAIDFPLLTVAIAAEVEGDGIVRSIEGVVTALGSRPRVLAKWSEVAAGRVLDDEPLDEPAARAHKQCHPLENIIVDTEWRRAMVPVYVKRALARVQAA